MSSPPVRDLGVTLVRYPGGNFVSGYNWRDGVGPQAQRPRRLDLAWRTLEPNTVGTDEFCAWARRAGVVVDLAVNLGTAGIDEARSLVEYCNHPGGSFYSDLRRAHGYPEPHGIKTVVPGQRDGRTLATGPQDRRRVRPAGGGNRPRDEVGRPDHRTGRLRQFRGGDAHLRRVGGDRPRSRHALRGLHLPTSVLQQSEATTSALSWPRRVEMDAFIHAVVAICDYVQARKRLKKPLDLAFDEWNVWYQHPAISC